MAHYLKQKDFNPLGSQSKAAIARKRRKDIICNQRRYANNERKTSTKLCKVGSSVFSFPSISSVEERALNTSVKLPHKKRKVSSKFLASETFCCSGDVNGSNQEKRYIIQSSNITNTNDIQTGKKQCTEKEHTNLIQGTTAESSSMKNSEIHSTILSNTLVSTSVETKEAMSPSKKTQKISKQKRYDPDAEIGMKKEQISAWRKEARKVRNRQSAAASREKILTRIRNLELEVQEWKHNYHQVMKRLGKKIEVA